jgi:uncharacterized membrane protein
MQKHLASFFFNHPKMKHIKTIALIIISIIALYYVIDRVLPYTSFNIEQYRDYWPEKWWLVGHLIGGMTALLVGPFQFSTAFRNRYLKVHRTLGKIYIVAIIIGSFCAIYMSLTVATEVNMAWSIGLFFLAIPWLISVLMAYRMIRLKRILQHREWMIRSYVITFAFVLFRFIDESSLAKSLMPTFEERGPTVIWISWAIPILITEVILQWNKKK